jgi:acetyl esterase/lipase
MLRQFASDYLAGADPKTPLASRLFASLAGLPPLLIQVGTADLLLSDSERLATAAAQAGLDVTLQVGEGLPHVYQLLLSTPEAARPPSKSGTSCAPGFANQTAHKQQVSRTRYALGRVTPAELADHPQGARRKARRTR